MCRCQEGSHCCCIPVTSKRQCRVLTVAAGPATLRLSLSAINIHRYSSVSAQHEHSLSGFLHSQIHGGNASEPLLACLISHFGCELHSTLASG